MNTELEEVYSLFLSNITDYDFLELSDEDMKNELKMLLKKSLSKFRRKDNIYINEIMDSFNRKLLDIELTIISLGMLSEYLNSKIYNIELLRMNLGSKDYQLYSQANHIKELISLKKETDSDFSYHMGILNLDTELARLVKK